MYKFIKNGNFTTKFAPWALMIPLPPHCKAKFLNFIGNLKMTPKLKFLV